jgi:hypothetical protein
MKSRIEQVQRPIMSKTFIRTCQSCGSQQEDCPPSRDKELSDAYRNRKCRKCRSEDLDYGSFKADPDDDSDITSVKETV